MSHWDEDDECEPTVTYKDSPGGLAFGLILFLLPIVLVLLR